MLTIIFAGLCAKKASVLFCVSPGCVIATVKKKEKTEDKEKLQRNTVL